MSADSGTWHRVRIDHAGQAARDEQVRGHTIAEAMANAESQWPLDRITYLGADDLLQDDPLEDEQADEDGSEPRDWWGDDYPEDGDDEADADEAAA